MRTKQWGVPWHRLTRDEQDLYLTLLWHDGFSEQAIADFFKGATKGRIVRRRQTGLRLTAKGRGKVKGEVAHDRFLDLLELHRMRQLEQESGGGIVCIAPVGTASENAGPEEKVEEEIGEKPAESDPAKEIPRPIPAPAITPVRRRKRSPPKRDTEERSGTCQWPLTSGGSLKEPRLCGEPTEPGKGLCKEHDEQLRKTLRRR